MPKTMKLYAVELTRKDGHKWLAHSGHGGPAVFDYRRDAVAFRDDLAAHDLPRGRVVKVTLTITEAKCP